MIRLLFLFFLFPLVSFSNEPVKELLIGKWEGKEKNGEIGYFIFEEVYAYISMEGTTYGGSEFDIEGNKMNLTYEIDEINDLIHLDFIVSANDFEFEMRLFCIIRVINKDKLEIDVDEYTRPSEFGESALILNRVKK